MSLLEYYWAKFAKKVRGRAILHSAVHSTAKIEPGTSFVFSTMARHSFCGYDCEIAGADIGPFTSIANGVVIGGGRHPVEWVGMSPVFYRGRDSVKKKYSEFDRAPQERTVVGADVWIGARAIVMQGVSIGTGAVIGAGAVVTRNVEPFTIVAGVPAKLIGERFNAAMRRRLLASEWWNLPDETLARAAQSIRDPESFLSELASCE